jgi:hypothetical protein
MGDNLLVYRPLGFFGKALGRKACGVVRARLGRERDATRPTCDLQANDWVKSPRQQRGVLVIGCRKRSCVGHDFFLCVQEEEQQRGEIVLAVLSLSALAEVASQLEIMVTASRRDWAPIRLRSQSEDQKPPYLIVPQEEELQFEKRGRMKTQPRTSLLFGERKNAQTLG